MEEHSNARRQDRLSRALLSISHGVLVVVFGLLPLLFIPLPSLPFEYTKVFAVIIGLAVALIFYSLAVLRSGVLSLSFPPALGALWLVVVVAGVSAFLSGDMRDALLGESLGIHTAAFLLLVAATATIWSLIGVRRENVMALYMLFSASAVVLTVFHLLRIMFGPEFLSFGMFTGLTSTPLGGWNDLALFLGLAILLALVAIEQLPLSRWGNVFFSLVALVALFMLAVINFSFVWIVLGISSLVVVIYTLSKHRRKRERDDSLIPMRLNTSLVSVVLSTIIFIVSVLFVLGGSFFGDAINRLTGISYIEVRPSFSATADIARGVYQDNMLLGIGPNKFIDAWRFHKDPSINETIFWNVDFPSGVGYIPTLFVTSGALGAVAWLLFLGLFVLFGLRMLFKADDGERGWYFIGTSAFIAAVFIWGMTLVYVPSSVVLLIGALCVGLTFVAENALRVRKVYTLSLGTNRRGGFLLTLGVVAVIIGSVGTLYGVGRHFAAVQAFSESVLALQPGSQLDAAEAQLLRAYDLSPNDLFARQLATYQLARINGLLGTTDPTAEMGQQFQTAAANGIQAAQLATSLDSTDPQNWAILGRLYASLIPAEVDQAYEQGKQALERARELDPKNPFRPLELAQLELAAGNAGEARTRLDEAVAMKSNYSDALFLLSQLDIVEGNVPSAIERTLAIISIEPNNPTRYYQLGILETSSGDFTTAAAAFEAAVRLNPDYANARYFLALVYSQQGKTAEATAELQKVLESNPGNELVTRQLAELETAGRINVDLTNIVGQPAVDPAAVTQNAADDSVTTTTPPDTPLVTPVNASGDQPAPAETETPAPPAQ